MQVKTIKVSEIKPYPLNNKDHTKSKKQIAESIKRFWFRVPILIDKDNVIISGHWRWLASQELGMKEVPTIMHEDLTEEQVKKLRAVDNLVSDVADYDIENISAEFGDWEDQRVTGLLKSIVKWFKLDDEKLKEQQEDVVPIVHRAEVIQEWDVVEIGNHRIMCWDSTDKEDVATLMNGAKADCVRTDPPYNVNYKWHASKTKSWIKNDKMWDKQFYSFLYDSFSAMKGVVKQWAGLYVFHNHKHQKTFEEALLDNQFDIKQQIVWNKPSLWLGAGDYRPKHELFFYCSHKGEKTTFYWDRTNSTVRNTLKDKSDNELMNMIKAAQKAEKEWKTTVRSISRDNVNEYEHPTQKPVMLCQLAINNSTKSEDIVLDLFLGSGTLVITCEKLNRSAYAMELDPLYVETTVKRYLDYTGTLTVKINGKEQTWDERLIERDLSDK